jgi:hypothetical protein
VERQERPGWLPGGPWHSAGAAWQGRLAAEWWVPATLPGFEFPKPVKNGQIPLNLNFKLVQTSTDPKIDLSELQNFKIKCGFEDLEKVNNFRHRNFFKFKMDLK